MTEQGIGTNIVCQIGLVVHDIEESARAYADVFGMDVPPISITAPEEEAHTRYRGAPTPARARLAFFQMGAISLELIEPVGGPSTWQAFLNEHGEGVHHIAFRIAGMDEVIAYLDGKGIPAVQRGDYTGGRYAYMGSEAKLAVIVELLERVNKG